MFRAGGDAWIPGSYDPGDQPDLLGHVAGQALDALRARHRRRRALHQLHARDRSGDRQDRLVLPAHPRRDARHGRDVRAHPRRSRRPIVGVHDGQARHPLGARSQDRRVPERARSRAIRTCSTSIRGPARRRIGPNMIPKAGVELEFCPSSSGFKSLRAMAYHPRHAGVLHPAEPALREGDVQRDVKRVEGGGGSGGVRRTNLMHPESPDGIGELLAMHAQNRRDAVAAPHAHAAEHRGAHDRRRPGGRRRLGPLSLRARRGDREDPVSDAAARPRCRAFRSPMR